MMSNTNKPSKSSVLLEEHIRCIEVVSDQDGDQSIYCDICEQDIESISDFSVYSIYHTSVHHVQIVHWDY